jgi:EmrB/QacA subfamily drug resistance transporter
MRQKNTFTKEPNGRVALTVSAFIVALVLAALDQTIVSTALPAISEELNERSRLSWVFSSYLIASTVVIPLYGKLGDLYGRKTVLQIAIGLFLVGSVLCGISTGMTELIVYRGLQGAGGGGLMTLTMTAVSDLVPDHERGRYLGMLGAAYGIAALFGPPLGGIFVEHLSWRWIFYANLPFGLLSMLMLAYSFHHRPKPRKHVIDYPGAVALTAALVMMLIGTKMSAASTDATLSASVVFPVVFPILALVFASLFLWIETRAPEPILPLELFREQTFTAANVLSTILGVSMFTAVVFLPLYLQIAQGFSPIASGMQLLPMTLGITTASLGCGRHVARVGRYRQFALTGCALVAVAYALLATMSNAPKDIEIPIYMLVLGLGLGLLFPVVTMAAQNSVSIQHIGTATATPIMLRSVGGAIGVSLLGALFSNRITHEFAHHFSTPDKASAIPGSEAVVTAFSAALHPLFWIAAAIAVIGFGVAWMLPGALAQSAYAEKPAELNMKQTK